MAKVLVLNPPKKTKKFRAKPAPKVRRKTKRSKMMSKAGVHRPRIIVKKRKLYRPKKSALPKRASFVNPYLGGLAVIGNPTKMKKRHHKKHKRHMRRNPFALNPKRKHRKHHRKSMLGGLLGNPGGAMAAVTSPAKDLISKDMLIDSSVAAAGFVLPNIVVSKLPAGFRDSVVKAYASKVGSVIVVSAAGRLVSKRVSNMLLLGGAIGLALDVYTDFIAPHLMGGTVSAAPHAAAPAAGNPVLSAWYGDKGVGAWYGDSQGYGMGDDYSHGIGEAFAS